MKIFDSIRLKVENRQLKNTVNNLLKNAKNEMDRKNKQIYSSNKKHQSEIAAQAKAYELEINKIREMEKKNHQIIIDERDHEINRLNNLMREKEKTFKSIKNREAEIETFIMDVVYNVKVGHSKMTQGIQHFFSAMQKVESNRLLNEKVDQNKMLKLADN